MYLVLMTLFDLINIFEALHFRKLNKDSLVQDCVFDLMNNKIFFYYYQILIKGCWETAMLTS